MIYTADKINLHTHSFYCGHGDGALSDFVDTALEKGDMKVLGFSEHCPVPDDNKNLPSRMPYSMFGSYIADIDRLKEEGKLVILKGAECDWVSKYLSYYKDDLLGERHFDYLLGSVHFMRDKNTGKISYIPHLSSLSVSDLKVYAKRYITMLESRIFKVGCHPDLFFAPYRRWDDEAIAVSKDIISCAKDNDIVLELNDLGLRKKPIETERGMEHPYTVADFWILAKDMGVRICTNTDAHRPGDLYGHPQDGFSNASFKMASELGIKFVSWDVSPVGKTQYELSAVNS